MYRIEPLPGTRDLAVTDLDGELVKVIPFRRGGHYAQPTPQPQAQQLPQVAHWLAVRQFDAPRAYAMLAELNDTALFRFCLLVRDELERRYDVVIPTGQMMARWRERIDAVRGGETYDTYS